MPLNRLIEWEKANGYKAKYVAKKLGLSASQYSQMKLGKIKPSIKVAERLKAEFNVEDVFELLKEET